MARRINEGWQTAVAEYRRGDTTRQALAARWGVSVSTLHRWVNRARRDARGSGDRPAILPVRVIASTAPSARWQGAEAGAVEMQLADGTQLTISTGTDVAYVASLVRALTSSPC